MPRSIIDVESSRPAYIRRNVMIVSAVVIAVIVAVFLFMEFRPGGSFSPNHGQTSRKVSFLP